MSAGRVRRVVGFAAAVLLAVVATPTLAAFTATITGNGHGTAASMVLSTLPTGASTCTSTGGVNAPFTSDTATCTSFPAGTLSSGSEGMLPVTFSSLGTSAPTSASFAFGSPGLQVSTDASANGDDAFPVGGVTFNASGPLSGSAASLDGTTGMLETQQAINDPGANLTLAAWFKVANGSTTGGGIIAFQNTQTGTPADADRKVWMDTTGKISAGAFPGAEQVATSTSSYNDGNWHFVVASFSSTSGLKLYVDGSSVATNTSATSGQNYVGYWTIGYSYFSSGHWTPEPSDPYIGGSLAEVAVIPSALSSAQVTTLYNSGTGTEAAFETRMLADSPSEFWPLQSAAHTTNTPDVEGVPDISGNNDLGTPQAGVSPSDAGPFGGDGAMYFDGATDGSSWIETAKTSAALPSGFTISAWFRAPSGTATGGGIMTFDTAQSGSGSGNDPAIWMDNSGKIVVDTYKSGFYEVTSSSAYNDGAWHYVAVTISATGLKMYVDGSQVASNSSVSGGGTAGGYWDIGVVNYTGSPPADLPTNAYWTGELAHVAYFPAVLSAAQISTLDGEATAAAFETQTLADSPTEYWPLTDSGTTQTESYPFFQIEPDVSGANDDATVVGSTVTLGTPGPLGSSNAAAFDGNTGYLETASAVSGPDTFSLVAWLKAPSHATGGGVVGFDGSQDGSGLSHDRFIWMDNAGKLVAGISGGSGVEATSSSTYDDGNWHLAVATFTPSAMKLYVDGSQVASVSSGISDNNFTGYWTVGFTQTSGTWADVPTNKEWTGSLADVAVIPSVLTAANVTTLYGEASQSALQTALLSFSPSAYWPLADSAAAPTDAGGLELTVQSANNGTTTCLFPAGAGSCPATTTSDFVPASAAYTPTAPTAAHATTVTLGVEEAATPPAGFLGLHFSVPLIFTGTLGSFTASLQYLTSSLQL